MNSLNNHYHDGNKTYFDLSLEFRSAIYGNRDDGWSVESSYWTSSDEDGEFYLNVEGILHSPYNFSTNSNHYVAWVIGDEE